MERFTPALPILTGLAMVTVAAFDYLPSSVAVAFVVLGAAMVCLGAFFNLLEDAIEIGPQGFKGKLRVRADAVIEAAEETSSVVGEVVRATMGTLSPGSRFSMYSGSTIDAVDVPEDVVEFKRRLVQISGHHPVAWPPAAEPQQVSRNDA